MKSDRAVLVAELISSGLVRGPIVGRPEAMVSMGRCGRVAAIRFSGGPFALAPAAVWRSIKAVK